MARRSKKADGQNAEGEQIQSSGPAATPGSDAIPEGELAYDGGDDQPASPKKAVAEKALAEATAVEAAKPKPVLPVKKFYRVTGVPRGGMIRAETGHRTHMGEGKVIDTSNYNIERLRQQGVKLEEVAEADARFG